VLPLKKNGIKTGKNSKGIEWKGIGLAGCTSSSGWVGKHGQDKRGRFVGEIEILTTREGVFTFKGPSCQQYEAGQQKTATEKRGRASWRLGKKENADGLAKGISERVRRGKWKESSPDQRDSGGIRK